MAIYAGQLRQVVHFFAAIDSVAGAAFDDAEIPNSVLARLPQEDLLAVDRFNVFGGGVTGQGHPAVHYLAVEVAGRSGVALGEGGPG